MNIDKPRDEGALRQLWKQAFGDSDAFLDSFFALGFSRDRCRCVYEAQTLAAAAYWFDVTEGGKKLAYLYAVATAEAFRGRGICHGLMAHIHEVLRKEGYDGVILVPGSGSLFEFYASMGYEAFGGLEKLQLCAGETKAALYPADAKTYARLRRELLPRGGVAQEGEMLSVLATQLDFFTGEDLVLCAAVAQDRAVIPEYLGDRAQLPAVVAALGAQQATVRIPGKGEFAMYLPLSDKGKKSPAYFGLALD